MSIMAGSSRYVKASTQLNTVHFISILFIVSYFLVPQYVGIDIAGFDLTVNRLFLVILFVCIFADEYRAKEFLAMIKGFKYLAPIICFEIVLVYTGVLRVDVNTMMNATIEFAFMFLLIYVIKVELGIELFIKIVKISSAILCVLGIQEYITGINLFHKLQTLDANFSQYVRSGSLRIMGPCGHALAYGLLLLLLLPLVCVDWEKKEINLLKNKALFFLIAINIFLTGSRSSLALLVLEMGLLFICSPIKRKKIAVLFLLVVVAAVAAFIVVFPGNSMSRYIMLQVTSVIDTVLGTDFAVSFGAETERLSNSSYYRKVLPKVFFVSYLNPVLGRGVSRHSSFQIDGISIISIDNFYVAQYIRYAYTGLLAYMWFVLSACGDMLKNWLKRKDAVYVAILIAAVSYYINLWWMDSLQTLRYMYALFALAYVYMQENGHFITKRRKAKKYESKYIRN